MAEIDRLTVVWDANFQKLDEKLNKVIRSNYGAARKVEQQWNQTNDNIFKSFAKGGAVGALEGLASRSPVAANGIQELGAAGLGLAAAMGAASVAVAQAVEAMTFGDELQATADKLQISAEALQALQYAADETDVPVQDLVSGLQSLNAQLGAIKTGVGSAKVEKVFAALGLTRDDLKDVQDATELLPILADRLGQISDTAEQVQLAKKLGVDALLPMLREGSDGIAEMTQRARELGLVLSNETVKGLADADRQMELAGQQIKNSLRAAFSGLATDIASATTGLANFLVRLRQIEQNAPAAFEAIMSAGALLSPGSAVAGAIRRNQRRGQGMAQPSLDEIRAGVRGIATAPRPAFVPTYQGGKAANTRVPKGTKDDPIKVEPVNAQDFTGQTGSVFDEIRVMGEAIRRRERDEANPDTINPLADLEEVRSGSTDMYNEHLKLAEDAETQYREGVRNGILDGLYAASEGYGVDFLVNTLRRRLMEGLADSLTDVFIQATKGEGGGGGGLFSAAASLLKKIPGFASGTNYAPGGLALVGERGAELVNLPRGSQVIPNNALRSLARGGGAPPPVYQFDLRGSVVTEDLLGQMNAMVRQGSVAAALAGARIGEQKIMRRGRHRL